MAGRVSQFGIEVDETGSPVGRISQFALEVDEIGNPNARVSQFAIEIAYVDDFIVAKSSLNFWNDTVTIALVDTTFPLTETVEDDLNNWTDTEPQLYQEVVYSIEVEDDLDNWDDIQEQLGYLVTILEDGFELSDAQEYFVTWLVPFSDTLSFSEAIEKLMDHFLGISDGNGVFHPNPKKTFPNLRDGTPSLQFFGDLNIVVVDDSNRWADSWDEDAVAAITNRGYALSDALLLVERIQVILHYLHSQGDTCTLLDVTNATLAYLQEVSDTGSLDDVVSGTSVSDIISNQPNVGDSLNYWNDTVVYFLSDTFIHYIRRYLNDLNYIPDASSTLLDFPIHNPQLIEYIRRYLNDKIPALSISIGEGMDFGDSIQ